MNTFLRPMSSLWGVAHSLRRELYHNNVLKSHHLGIPVISIGNITFGGTGKTPFTLHLAKYIEKHFEKNGVVLTRGYKSELENSSGVLRPEYPHLHNSKKFGDEPVMLIRNLHKWSVITGKNRIENFKMYKDDLKPDIAILEDGFQHMKIHRDINIVLFDALKPISSYKTAPVGILREEFDALADADFVFISRADLLDKDRLSELENLISEYTSAHIGHFGYSPGLYEDVYSGMEIPLNSFDLKDIHVTTAIADPSSFYQLLSNQGFNILKKNIYADHFYFNENDYKEMIADLKKDNCILMITEKDMVKLTPYVDEPNLVYACKIDTNISKAKNLLYEKIGDLFK